MDELFSCRNCVNNCAQTIHIGAGVGFCVQHNSVIKQPSETTCKYLHRKDLPGFVVNDGISEHAAEFAHFPGLVSLRAHKPVPKTVYSELHAWETKSFDPLLHSLAQYHKANPAWVFIQSFSGGLDGRRSLAHTSLIRRYMNHCGTWTSSYRLVLASLQELDCTPHFERNDLAVQSTDAPEEVEEVREQALWDVVFSRLSGLQEYGWHAGIERIMWATDELNGALSEMDWSVLAQHLHEKGIEWTELIIEHAKEEGEFFPSNGQNSEEFR